MKTVVSVQEVSELDLKPVDAVRQWRSLVKKEIDRRWSDRSSWIQVDWPTCDSGVENFAFNLDGFCYAESPVCGSLYVPIRPDENEIWSWYRTSEPSKFWREQLLLISKKNRLEKINEPRSDWISDGIAEYIPSATCLLDISSNSSDLINLVAAKNVNLKNIIMAGMTADLEGNIAERINVKPTRVSNISQFSSVNVIVAIDILDRTPDIALMINALEKTLAPGGIAFITTPVSSGFEIQTLWDMTPSIQPPDRLNIPSIKGLQMLFSPPKWEILELSTPGMFDVASVEKTVAENPSKSWPRIVKSFINGTDGSGKIALVELLQSQRLSSFARLVVKRMK